jgi:tocopherol O-methyltransferase
VQAQRSPTPAACTELTAPLLGRAGNNNQRCCRYIAKKLSCQADGITLSPVQAQRASELAAAQGLADCCMYSVVDALKQPFADNTFDLVWSLESGEHMPDKKKFVGELLRVAAPGGKVAIVTWCHRNLLGGEATLLPDEQEVLDRINEAYYLPKWCSLADYVELFSATSCCFCQCVTPPSYPTKH